MLGLFTHGISVPSGLFIPVILAGATNGRLVGMFMDPFTKRLFDASTMTMF